MICGIGTDIARVSRFERWVKDARLIGRFFNSAELLRSPNASMQRQCEYYAVRFAAKEAFSKALGTGLNGFDLCDIYIQKDSAGMPALEVTGRARLAMEQRFGTGCRTYVSLSHEKEYALAFVVIERGA